MFRSQTFSIILFFSLMFFEILLISSIISERKTNQRVESVQIVLFVINTIVLSFVVYIMLQFANTHAIMEPILY